MTNFPYTYNRKNLRKFFAHIQDAAVPEKVNKNYLEKVGFKSFNDRAIITILKFIGLLDASGVPTDRWKDYRDRNKAKVLLADAIRESYKDLFATLAPAHIRDNEALQNYFRSQTNVSSSTLSAIVNTFKVLCDLSDFEEMAKPPVAETLPEKAEAAIKERPGIARVETLNINIQLQLPATADESIYEKIFAALKKHLMSD